MIRLAVLPPREQWGCGSPSLVRSSRKVAAARRTSRRISLSERRGPPARCPLLQWPASMHSTHVRGMPRDPGQGGSRRRSPLEPPRAPAPLEHTLQRDLELEQRAERPRRRPSQPWLTRRRIGEQLSRSPRGLRAPGAALIRSLSVRRTWREANGRSGRPSRRTRSRLRDSAEFSRPGEIGSQGQPRPGRLSNLPGFLSQTRGVRPGVRFRTFCSE